MIYKSVELKDGELIQFVGVHALRWDYERWGEPTMGFIEMDDDLIDAAPDLLAACKEALEILADYTDIDWLVTQLVAAIKKAEGESNVSMA